MSSPHPHSLPCRCPSPSFPGAWPSSLPPSSMNEEAHICAFSPTCEHALPETMLPIGSRVKRDSPVPSCKRSTADASRNLEILPSIPVYDPVNRDIIITSTPILNNTLADTTSMLNSVRQPCPDKSDHKRSSSYIGRLLFEENDATTVFDDAKQICGIGQRDSYFQSLGCNISNPCILFSTPSVTEVPDSTYPPIPPIKFPSSSVCQPVTPVETDVDQPFSCECFRSWESQVEASLSQGAQHSRRSPSLSPLISRRNFSVEDLSWLSTLDTSGFSYGDDSDQSSPVSFPPPIICAADALYNVSNALHALPQPDGINAWTLSLSPLSVSPTLSTSYASVPSSGAHYSLELGENLERRGVDFIPVVVETPATNFPVVRPRPHTDERETYSSEYACTLLASALESSDGTSEAESDLQIRNPGTTKSDDTSYQELQLPSKNRHINSINDRVAFTPSLRRTRNMMFKLKTTGCKVWHFFATKSRALRSVSRTFSQRVYLSARSNKIVQPPSANGNDTQPYTSPICAVVSQVVVNEPEAAENDQVTSLLRARPKTSAHIKFKRRLSLPIFSSLHKNSNSFITGPPCHGRPRPRSCIFSDHENSIFSSPTADCQNSH